MTTTVGYVCGGAAVFLVVLALWVSGDGNSSGLAILGLGLALLLAAVLLLGEGERKV
jgi:hypothetical protein